MKHESFVDDLTKILVQRNIIKKSEAVALAQSFRDSEAANFDQFLIDEGLVEKDDLLGALAQLYQAPAFDAIGYFFDHELVRMFPKEFLLQHEIIPIEIDENMLIFAASNPNDPELLPLIGEHVSYDPHFQVSIREDIIDSIEEFYDSPVTQINPEFDADDDETRFEREDEIARDEKLEEMDIEDIEDNE